MRHTSVGLNMTHDFLSLGEGLAVAMALLPLAQVSALACADMVFRQMTRQLIKGFKALVAVDPPTNVKEALS